MIDALPVIAALAARFVFAGAASATTPIFEILFWFSVALYILHTMAAELLTGRSIGKMVCGLRVVSLSGEPARPGQIVTRNLLRVVDAVLFFTPLLLVPFSPIGQRIGDAAAGTIVVART
jgi:uncharacterized RDD family membrane protein YckC